MWVQSQRTTPVEPEDAVANVETWAALEQVMWAELGKVRDQTQDVPKLYALCEKIQQAQQSHEKQLTVLRRFARQVEQHLEQLQKGAAPRDTIVSYRLMKVDKVCLRCMCLVLLPQVQLFHYPLCRCQHH